MTLDLVQGDAKIKISGALTDENGAVLDVTGCTVNIQMRKKTDNRYTINAACQLDNPSGGLVSYTTGVNDLNNDGDYLLQYEVNYPDGTVITTKDWIPVTVRRQ